MSLRTSITSYGPLLGRVSSKIKVNVSQEDPSDLPNGASAHSVGERRDKEVSPFKPPTSYFDFYFNYFVETSRGLDFNGV